MFHKIVVAYNESPESQRALASALKLAQTLNAELMAATVMTELPSYTAFAGVTDPSVSRSLKEDRRKFYDDLQDKARSLPASHGVELHTHLIEGEQVEAIVDILRKHKADLLVVGLHQRDFLISRLWSTVCELAQEAPCCVLGVH